MQLAEKSWCLASHHVRRSLPVTADQQIVNPSFGYSAGKWRFNPQLPRFWHFTKSDTKRPGVRTLETPANAQEEKGLRWEKAGTCKNRRPRILLSRASIVQFALTLRQVVVLLSFVGDQTHQPFALCHKCAYPPRHIPPITVSKVWVIENLFTCWCLSLCCPVSLSCLHSHFRSTVCMYSGKPKGGGTDSARNPEELLSEDVVTSLKLEEGGGVNGGDDTGMCGVQGEGIEDLFERLCVWAECPFYACACVHVWVCVCRCGCPRFRVSVCPFFPSLCVFVSMNVVRILFHLKLSQHSKP